MTLIFKRKYLDRIVGGEKTATRRASRPMVKPRGIYRMRAGFFEYLPDRIRVLRIYTQRMSDMTSEDVLKEGFASPEEFRLEWTGIYRS
ncbi:MAG: ASCH domain-containing protein [Candidatus Bathyarchaeota archaeon]|nr:ASCH domain-containing protein [Candidatus Bathyarchaeota archaeon]